MAVPGFPFGIKTPLAAYPPALTPAGGSNIPDVQRAQMMEFSHRLRNFGLPYNAAATTHPHLQNRLLQVDPLFYLYGRQDPRMGFFHEEPKPSHSYIGLIGMAILNSKEKKLVLSDIYQWILDNYPYFRTRGPGWRNSIRHNLSLNDCFIKSGRAANGKGHYWAVHPAVESDFEKGDFRRRRAQRKVRKAMGLAVPDEDDSPSPSPPTCTSDASEWRARFEEGRAEGQISPPVIISPEHSPEVLSQQKALSRGLPPPVLDGRPALHPPPPPHAFLPWVNISHVQWKQMQQNLLLAGGREAATAAFTTRCNSSNNSANNNNETVSCAPPTLKDRSPFDPPKAKRRAFDVESLLAPDARELREGVEITSPSTSYDNTSQADVSIEAEQEEEEESDVEIEDLDDSSNIRPPVTSTPKDNGKISQ